MSINAFNLAWIFNSQKTLIKQLYWKWDQSHNLYIISPIVLKLNHNSKLLIPFDYGERGVVIYILIILVAFTWIFEKSS